MSAISNHIYFNVLKRNGITFTDYMVAERIYHLAYPGYEVRGWAVDPTTSIASYFDLPEGVVTNSIDRLEQRGLVDRDGQNLRTTQKWSEHAYGTHLY